MRFFILNSWIMKVSASTVFALGCPMRLYKLFMACRHLALAQWHLSKSGHLSLIDSNVLYRLTLTLFSLLASTVLYIVISVYFSPSAVYFPSFYTVCRGQRQEILHKARLLWDVVSVIVIKGHIYSEWLWYEEQDLSLRKVLGSGPGSTTSVIGLLDNIVGAKLSYMKTESFPASFWEPLQGPKEGNYLAVIRDILVIVYGYVQNGSS